MRQPGYRRAARGALALDQQKAGSDSLKVEHLKQNEIGWRCSGRAQLRRNRYTSDAPSARQASTSSAYAGGPAHL
jgi:hypothetical protein